MRTLLITITLLILSVSAFAQDTPDDLTYAYPFQNATGNRYLPDVSGTFPDVQMAEVQLGAVPQWVVGGLVNDNPAWLVALADGRVVMTEALTDVDDVSGMAIEVGQLAPGQPLAAIYDGVNPPSPLVVGAAITPFTLPVAIDRAQEVLAYVAENGDLVAWQNGEVVNRLALEIQQDAYPVVSDDGMIAVYGQATSDRYVHGIMGDEIEGAVLYTVQFNFGQLVPMEAVELDGNNVFEGLAPFWADVNDDGEQEIVTTVSNGDVGAWLRVYNAGGDVIAESDPIGQGLRWRHQIAVAPFGINGETQIADVRTPHIAGMAEFLNPEGDRLVMNNAQLGYTSHLINSRNMDQALAGDFNSNDKPELVLTDQSRQFVTGVENTTEGVVQQWELPLDGTLTTNLAAVTLPDGGAVLAAGTDNGVLRVWR
jgi:hypothetical protein